jgi:endonuclease/exonuclease/phosphatase (EEP) superfamily protein YafD
MQGEEKRLAQARAILDNVPKNQPHVIVGGDFNTMRSESLLAHLYIFQKNQFDCATGRVGPTAKFGPFGTKLDHVFVKGLRAVAAGRVIDSRASDHLPVWVKLVLR